MKKINCLLKQKMVCGLILVILSAGNPAFCEEPEFRVSIRGAIANIAEVGAYINEGTYLRLYPCEASGELQIEKNAAGNLVATPEQAGQKFYLDGFSRMVPFSGLPATGLPVFGGFNFFKTRGLEPGGCYKISVMMLDPPYAGMVLLTDGAGEPIEIIVPETEAEKPGETREVDLTKTPLMIPLLYKK